MFKKFLSLAIALMLVLSVAAVGFSAAQVEITDEAADAEVADQAANGDAASLGAEGDVAATGADVLKFDANSIGWSGMKESDWEKCPEEKILSKEDWNVVPTATLFGYKGKDLVYKGREHGNLYVEDPKDMEHIYLSYAHL